MRRPDRQIPSPRNLLHLRRARALAGDLAGAVEAIATAIDLLEDRDGAEETPSEIQERLEDDGGAVLRHG